MEEDNYESDRRVLDVYTIGSEETISSVATDRDRSPDTVKWTADGQTFIVSSEDRGRVTRFSLPTNAGPDDVPQNFTDGGAVSAFHLLPDSTVLVRSGRVEMSTSQALSAASSRPYSRPTMLTPNRVA